MNSIGQVCNITGLYKCSLCGMAQIVQAGAIFPNCSYCHRKDLEWNLTLTLSNLPPDFFK